MRAWFCPCLCAVSSTVSDALFLAMRAWFCPCLCAVSSTVLMLCFWPCMHGSALVFTQFLPQFLMLSFGLYMLYPAHVYSKPLLVFLMLSSSVCSFLLLHTQSFIMGFQGLLLCFSSAIFLLTQHSLISNALFCCIAILLLFLVL